MGTAVLRKSVRDLTRRKARAAFTIATLALAVAGVGIYAMPTLIDRTMQDEIAAGRIANLTVRLQPLALGDATLDELGEIPHVVAVEPRYAVSTRVYVGERRADGYIEGIRDFGAQRVDVVRLREGAPPRRGEVLTEAQNANQDVFGGSPGDTVRIVGPGGGEETLRIGGVGHSLGGGQDVTEDGEVVLYADATTVADLTGSLGVTSLAFRLEEGTDARVTAAAVREVLAGVRGFSGFTDLPEVRAADYWPGKENFRLFIDFFSVVTVLALLSSVVLIANTMTTLVAEETREIGVMKALGARRRQVARVYLTTALLLGAAATVVGTALGVLLANVLVDFLGETFFAVDVTPGVDVRVLVASAAVGLLAPPLAALPAIRRAVRVDLREALEATGSAVGQTDAADRLVRRARFLPRTVAIGLRNAARRKRRGLATAVIVALAVGNLLAVLGLAAATSTKVHAAWDEHGEDVKVVSRGARPLDDRAVDAIRVTPGVAAVEPMFATDAVLDGEDAVIWAIRQRTMFRHDVSEGRWFSPAEESADARVVVVQRSLARVAGVDVGDRVRLDTAAGAADFRVVGIAENAQEEGTAVYVPLATMHALQGGGRARDFDLWVRASSSDHAFVDRVTTRLEDTLASAGYDVGTEILYVREADDARMFDTVMTSIAVLGLLVVAISTVGLANALTMSVLERRREIGILRCVGARARDVRRIFLSEGLVLALAGWLLGIPIGYALMRLLVWFVDEFVHVDLAPEFPLANVWLALAGTVVLALVVLALPVRRATRMRPGDALRYA
ncbi:MAG TPA: FtsX-like permease family protein [Gaiellaceae bacterium]|nr:FtsX-like permease family protein [Gaiellaceae bacterium]